MRVISSSDYVATRLARASYTRPRKTLPWLALGLALPAIVLAVAGLVQRLRDGSAPAAVWWGAGVFAATALIAGVAAALVERAYRGRRAEREQLSAGLAGQQLLPRFLAGLDDSYYLLTNLKLPGRGDDIDHVLVGPTGLFALEVKHHRGRIFVRDGEWIQTKTSRGGRLQPEVSMRDPVQQLKRNVDYLRSCINRTDPALGRRTRLWIEGAVVFTHPEAQVDLPETLRSTLPFPVLRGHDLPSYISGHVPRQPLSRADVASIASLLAHLQLPDRDSASTGKPSAWTRRG